MTVVYVAAGTAGTTTPGMPAGVTSGDWIVVVAYRSGSTAQPTMPANWTTIINQVGANANSALVSYRVYDGVWTMPAFTNAGRSIALGLRASSGKLLATGITEG